MIFGIVSVLFGGLLGARVTAALFTRLLPVSRVRRRGTQADGVVTEVKIMQVGRSAHQLPRPIVAFTDTHGQRVSYTDTMVRPGTTKAADHVTVYYDPADPEHTATIATKVDMSRQYRLGVLVILVLAAIFVNGWLLIAGVVQA